MRPGLRSRTRPRARSSATWPRGAWSTCAGPGGIGLSAVGTGHLRADRSARRRHPGRQREVKALVELRVPFELYRQAIDDVERGADDSDWQPLKDAARQIAFAEDRAIFEGYAAAASRHPPGDQQSDHDAPGRVRRLSRTRSPRPSASCVSSASTAPTRCCSAPTPTPPWRRPATTATRCWSTSSGWSTARSSGRPPSPAASCSPRAAAISICTSARTSRSAISATTDTTVRLYLQESFTFLLLTTEAAVALAPPAK